MKNEGNRYEVRGTGYEVSSEPIVCDETHLAPRTSHLALSTAYAPNIEYISKIAQFENVCIDISEPYIRQTFRNRCEILTSQGVQKLSIPIDKKSCFDPSTGLGTNKRPNMIKDVKIDYAENWQRLHWRSFQAAYNNSPYFLYYKDEFRFFYEKRWDFLVEFNAELLMFILKKMKIGEKKISYEVRGTGYGVCNKPTSHLAPHTSYQFSKYHQVFGETFVPNLSSLDLLFNCGPESKSYLCENQKSKIKNQKS